MGECLKKAIITPQTNEQGEALGDAEKRSRQCEVDFNPDTLRYTISSRIGEGKNARPAQTITESTSTLTMELTFDSTTTGADVRHKTQKLVTMFDPAQNTSGSGSSDSGGGAVQPVAARVLFEWGNISFTGYISSYSETIELFSHEGIPLRSQVSLSIVQQNGSFAPRDNAQSASGIDKQLDLNSSAQSIRLGGGAGLSMSLSAGISASASVKGVAELNGIENLRMPEVGNVMMINQKGRAPAAFSVGSGAGAGAGAGFGLGAGIGAGVGVGASAGIGAGAGVGGAAGVSMGGGIGGSATASAFAGLNAQAGISVGTPRSGIGAGLNVSAGAQAGLGSNSNFCNGGTATNQGSGSLSADVGINANISFEGG